MLVDKLCAVVDFVVDHDKQVLLCVVLSNILVGVLGGRHFGWGEGGGGVGAGRSERKFGVFKISLVLSLVGEDGPMGLGVAGSERERGDWTLSTT